MLTEILLILCVKIMLKYFSRLVATSVTDPTPVQLGLLIMPWILLLQLFSFQQTTEDVIYVIIHNDTRCTTQGDFTMMESCLGFGGLTGEAGGSLVYQMRYFSDSPMA